MGDLGDAYRGIRMRVIALVSDADPGSVLRIAPATPQWTVKDNVAHLVGVTADIVNRNLDGVATDAWTAAQVDARRTHDLPDLLTEWDAHATAVEAIVDGFGPAGHQLVTDAVTHEHDIRGGLDQPGARDSDAVHLGFEFVGRAVGRALDTRTSGALQVEHEGGMSVFGRGDPVLTLRTTRFEFLRATTGRRSPAQVAALDWNGGSPPDGLVLDIAEARPDPLEE